MNGNEEKPVSRSKQSSTEAVSEQQERAQRIERYIGKKILQSNESLGASDEQEIQDYYATVTPREKAEALYNKVMAYMVDRRIVAAQTTSTEQTKGEFQLETIDPYLVSEIKILFGDAQVRELFPSTYGQARVDAKRLRQSDLGYLWQQTREEISAKEETYKQLEKDLHLNVISGRGKVTAAQSRMNILAQNLTALERRKKNVETLQGVPETRGNTDVAAQLQYEQLKQYKTELEGGFVWLPSRKKIHKETISALLNHRWPVLVGEAGSGKSQQANAAAIELTGYAPTEIECESTTGEIQLIKDPAIDPATGGSYERFGPLMQAFTGYEDSRQKQPAYTTGRIVRFDESGRLGPKAYSIIKKTRQRKPGDDFYGHSVLAGASAIWTSNPVGPRYPDRHAPDPAMRRELAEIHVDYPDMSSQSPELYEFALTALLDENNHINAAQMELAPAYTKQEIPNDKQITLKDGSVIIAKDAIIEDMADTRHGSLWRFCAAVKTLQDGFVYGNAEASAYPANLLRFKEDAQGNINTVTDGSGEPLTFSTSTITLGELASWMQGFNERLQKQDEEFRVKTLTEWMNFKINTYIKQADKGDKDKIQALFKHFGFLTTDVIPDIADAQPLTPKEIGYLSPRVPRPAYIERPATVDMASQVQAESQAPIRYETRQVLFENGERILIKTQGFELPDGDVDPTTGTPIPLSVDIGRNMAIEDQNFTFAGIVEDEQSDHHGMLVGKIQGEDLYRALTAEEVDMAIFDFDSRGLIQKITDILPDKMKKYWSECCADISEPAW